MSTRRSRIGVVSSVTEWQILFAIIIYRKRTKEDAERDSQIIDRRSRHILGKLAEKQQNDPFALAIGITKPLHKRPRGKEAGSCLETPSSTISVWSLDISTMEGHRIPHSMPIIRKVSSKEIRNRMTHLLNYESRHLAGTQRCNTSHLAESRCTRTT